MSPIKDFQLTYQANNQDRFFSEGDVITGAVAFLLTKETKVQSLHVKASGKGRVSWSEGSGDDQRTYSAHSEYFKCKEYLLAEDGKGNVLAKGVHRFQFRIQIPEGSFPSSFKGSNGNIVYKLEAKLSRSWRWPSKAQTEISFVSRSLSHNNKMTCPLSGSVDKSVGVFSKGEVHLSATINRKVCSPGDTLSVVANIRNSSSKTVRPKFSLKQIIVYRASGSSTSSEKSLFKAVGDPIAKNSEETVSCKLADTEVPNNATYTINNCEILSVEYYLKVSLDISFSFNPEVRFPLIIVPPSFSTISPGAAGPYPAGAAGAPSYSDFPPPTFPTGSYPAPAGSYPTPVGPYLAPAGPHHVPVGPYPGPSGPPAYGYPAPAPAQYQNMPSGYNNQWPPQTTPQGFPPAAFSSPLVQHQTPSAPPLQEEQPPAYQALFPLGEEKKHKS